VNSFVEGATMLSSFAVAAFFLRYWRDTGDRLFAVFSAAFGLFGANRVLLHLLDESSEVRTWAYAVRAATFLMLIAAVIDKNVARMPSDNPAEGGAHDRSR
jgi:hypothetical protein